MHQCWIFTIKELFHILVLISIFSYQNKQNNHNYIFYFFHHHFQTDFIFSYFGFSEYERINKVNSQFYKYLFCFIEVFYKSEGGQTTSLLCRGFVLYRHSKNITSQSSLWKIRKQGVLGTRMLTSHFWSPLWFGRMSIFMFLDPCYIWFVCSVFPVTNLIDRFRITGLVFQVVYQREGGQI